MKVTQVAEIVNTLTKEMLGETTEITIADDLSDIVSVGKAIFDAASVDNYVRKLVDHIGRMVFVNRPYSSRAPSVLMENWEYGSVLEKIDAGIPDAEENPAWKLEDGQSYDVNKFTAPKDILVQFFNDKVTFQIAMSFTEEQVKSAFSSGTQLNAFFSMIYTKIETSFTLKLDSLIMATINNFIANVFNNGQPAQKRNLLEEYNTAYPDNTISTAAAAVRDPNFIRFAAYEFKNASSRLGIASKVFNIGKRIRHTPTDRQRIIMLDLFANAADIYLQSDTFHNEFVKLPNADKISFWQYTGDNFDFEDISQIKVIPNTSEGKGSETNVTGILGTIFDKEALGVNNYNRRTTSNYNGLGEFINYWYKMDARYFNDFNENFILFYIAA